jgi:ribonuclease PH
MAQIPTSSDRQFTDDSEIWHNLKSAIAASSGFQRWQLERNNQLQGLRLEQQVQRYLRETLETLAY